LLHVRLLRAVIKINQSINQYTHLRDEKAYGVCTCKKAPPGES